MQTSLLTIGIILVVIGIIGIVFNYYATWMWVLVILGIIGIIWGWVAGGKRMA